MKKIYKFILVLLIVFFSSAVAFAQFIEYEDDFESYTTGGYIAVQNPEWWTTWSGSVGGGEDAIITEDIALSGSKSILIDETGGATDLLWLLGDKVTGVYHVDFYMYVPLDYCAYYNFQHMESPGVEWAFEMYFHTDGTCKFLIAGEELTNYTYPHNEWMYIEHIISLNKDSAQIYIDGEFIYQWQWSLEAQGASGANKLGAVNFFAGAEGVDFPMYYLDDMKYVREIYIPDPEIMVDPYLFDVSLGIDQIITDELIVANEGEGDLNYTISIEYADDNWLSVNPTSGTLQFYEVDFIDVNFNSTGLEIGVYEASIIIESNDPNQAEIIIPVSMDVTSVLPHWVFEGGDPSAPLWTIYIGGAILAGVDLEPGDEIGIFDGDLLVGAITLHQVCTPDNQFENDLTAFSVLVSGEGYQPGNPYYFECWDASIGIEVGQYEIELFDPYGDAYSEDVFPLDDGEYSIVALDFLSGRSQKFNLSFGFQFISSNIIPDDPNMLVVMADILNDNLDFVRNSLGHTFHKIGPNWVNGIGDWVVDEGYLVKMYADDSFTIIGCPIFPITPIPVEAGFQFVSYFLDFPINALDAFETIIGDDLDFVINSQGLTLRKIGPNWVNGIGDCQPGEGYLVKMFADGEIIYPAWAKSSGKITMLPVNFNFEGGNPAEPVYTLYIKGLKIGDEVAAFDGNKLIGAVKINSENAFENELPVFSTLTNGQGYESGNPITLKVWSENKFLSADFTLEAIYDSYVSDVYPEGDGKYSVVNITKGEIENIDETISVYPNPTNGIFNISLEGIKSDISIKVFDLRGKEYSNFELSGSTSTQLDLTDLAAGVYFINFSSKDFKEVKKIVIK